MKTKNILFFVLLLSLLNACEKVEKVENFPKHDSKLVTNCLFTSDSFFIFHLSKSLSPLDNAPFRNMNSSSAYIRVYENNTLFDSIRVKNGVFMGDFNKRPKPNTTYRFDCYYPGFGVVKGEDYLPDTFKVKNVRGVNLVKRVYDYHMGSLDSSKYVEHTSEIHFTLESDHPHGDYVFIEINMKYKFGTGFYRPYFYPELIGSAYDSETVGSSLFVSNNGKKITDLKIKWDFSDYYPSGKVSNKYEVKIYTCSANTYEYLRRSRLQAENNEDPFAQPTPISNNILNGFGIFGGFQVQQFELDF
jgi:hypothetical protein